MFKPWPTAAACIQRCDHGAGTPLTLDECSEQVKHPLTGLSRDQLVGVIAYLSAQVVGYQHRGDQNATLAVAQIGRIVQEYQERTA